MKCLFFESDSYHAGYNLAVEEYLFKMSTQEACAILYLWQNENTIVLGKNQNADIEYDKIKAEKYGITVVRRMTGGGCVYHDLGNLNFTFIAPINIFEKEIMFGFVSKALEKYGIKVDVTGRNDIYVDNYKFSGNAYSTNGKCVLHHGTILVDADLDRMDEVLNTSCSKLAKRGVKSVKAKVKNLKDIHPQISIIKLKSEIQTEFVEWANLLFGDTPKRICIDEYSVTPFLKKYMDSNWNLGKDKKYLYEKTAIYNWGEARIAYNENKGCITEVKIYTDSLQIEEVEELEKSLIGESVDKI